MNKSICRYSITIKVNGDYDVEVESSSAKVRDFQPINRSSRDCLAKIRPIVKNKRTREQRSELQDSNPKTQSWKCLLKKVLVPHKVYKEHYRVRSQCA